MAAISFPTGKFARSLKVALAILALCTTPLMNAGTAQAKGEYDVLENKWDAPERVLEFPPSLSLGTIIIQNDWRNRGRTSPAQIVQARGKVVIPKNRFVTFQASKEFFKNPKLIANFPPTAFDCVILKLMSMDDSEDDLCDHALAQMTHLKGIRAVILDKSEVTDSGMKALASLPNLEYISAFLTPLRGTFFKDLKGNKKLTAMSLDSVGLKDEEFKALADYPNLQMLQLSRANVTNQGMRYLAACKNLRWLDVGKNPGISDDSMQYIKQLKNLQHLEVHSTSLTGTALMQLKGTGVKFLATSDGTLNKQQIAALKAAMPDLLVTTKGGPATVDEETGTIFGQMSRQRRF
ncbi:MAG: hypothetical protein JSS83_02495 [Cyanobacteria bacterium SZAS LIN-3]|nr:hypothetical protein [Cyanobacteria bacterium SZAS LIN-3]